MNKLTLDDVKQYIDNKYKECYSYDGDNITDTNIKLKLMTSINDISYETIYENYNDNAINFLSRFLNGNIVLSRFKESENNENLHQEEQQYISTKTDVPASATEPNGNRNIKDVQLNIDMSNEIQTDGIRVLK